MASEARPGSTKSGIAAMKCQKCSKAATLHITEVHSEEQFEELHLCEECAQKYLYEPQSNKPAIKTASGASESDDSGLPNRECSRCGIKFVEFRNTGRLGCPYDYEEFREELLPLLENIHGDPPKHLGKAPRRHPQTKQNQSELAQLRKELLQAVNREQYEEAARLRDRIRQLEES
jgi:protein arginine kinase activator